MLFPALFQMVAPVHNALVENAVPDSEHVPDLVHHDPYTLFKDPFEIQFVLFLPEEPLVVPCEREDPGSFPQTRDAEDEIPLLLVVEIGRADAEHAESVFGYSCF